MSNFVFLGGTCGSSPWRKEIAIPKLEAAGVKYFDPEVADWTPECIPREAAAKAEAAVLLFFIDGTTRGIASMIEAAEYAHSGREVFFAIQDIPDGTVIDGQTVTGRELKDLNRARAYCKDSLLRSESGVEGYGLTLDAVLDLIIARMRVLESSWV